MLISYGALAGLIAAVTFLLFVSFTIPVLSRTTKTLKKVEQTMDITNDASGKMSNDIDDIMKQTNDLLDKTNDLLEDVDSKVKTVEPVVQAATDLGGSVSNLSSSSRKPATRSSEVNTKETGLMTTILTSILARHRRRRGLD